MGAAARQSGRMDQRRGDGHARARPGVLGRLRWLGIACAGADDTDADVRIATVRGRCRRKPAVLRGDVWRAVPAAAVLASYARLRSAGRRAAVAAVDIDAVPDRAAVSGGLAQIWP